MDRVDYDGRLHVGFHEGRSHADSVMQLWRKTVRRCIGDRSGLNILDLGSGTGRFSCDLANEFDSHVVGVEPSDKMREVAESECQHPNVRFLKGSAEHIPLTDESCDAAWLSQVVHHIPDIDLAAAELRRVVRESGLVIFRSNFKGRLDGFCHYYNFFPTGLAVDEARHPTVQYVEQCFDRHGFRLVTFETVEQMEAGSLSEYAERIRRRTYSTFELIPQIDFDEGLRALQQATQAETADQPVMSKVDLLVFESR